MIGAWGLEEHWQQVVIASLVAVSIVTAQADDHRRDRREREHNHNYIIERQENYQVPSGSVPTDRLIIGKREIDIYPNGQMFEGSKLVGVKKNE